MLRREHRIGRKHDGESHFHYNYIHGTWSDEPREYIDKMRGIQEGIVKAVYLMQSNDKQAYVTCYIAKRYKVTKQHGAFRIIIQESKKGMFGWYTKANASAYHSQKEANEAFINIKKMYDSAKRIQ
jgi:hypothetical protein